MIISFSDNEFNNNLFYNYFFLSWEMRFDSRGRTYYVDHNTRTTTWQRPTQESVSAYNQWREQQATNLVTEQSQYQQRFLNTVTIVFPFAFTT